MICDPDEPGYLGATRLSAPVAELSAITAIFSLLLARLAAPPPALAVRVDSVYALEVVACRARARTNHALVSLARSVALRIRATSQVAFEQVSAHGGETGT